MITNTLQGNFKLTTSKVLAHLAKLLSMTSSLFLMLVCLGIAAVTFSHFFSWPLAGRLVVVRTGSMEPAVTAGSLVWITSSPEYQIGDIVAFTHPSSNSTAVVALHRIIRQTVTSTTDGSSALFATKGDANTTADEWAVTQSDIYGRVRWAIPHLGYLIIWLQTDSGVLLSIVMPAVVLVSHGLRSAIATFRTTLPAKVPDSV